MRSWCWRRGDAARICQCEAYPWSTEEARGAGGTTQAADDEEASDRRCGGPAALSPRMTATRRREPNRANQASLERGPVVELLESPDTGGEWYSGVGSPLAGCHSVQLPVALSLWLTCSSFKETIRYYWSKENVRISFFSSSEHQQWFFYFFPGTMVVLIFREWLVFLVT
jgi:hypothetical protein